MKDMLTMAVLYRGTVETLWREEGLYFLSSGLVNRAASHMSLIVLTMLVRPLMNGQKLTDVSGSFNQR
jgi:hypothetical protein